MFFPVFLASIVIIIVLLFLYARKLGAILSYSQSHDLPIFGQRYRSVLTLSADGYFLNELFSGKQIGDIDDSGLRDRLRIARKLLRLQIGLGLLVFFSVLAIAFTSRM